MAKRKRINKAKVQAAKADQELRTLITTVHPEALIFLDHLNSGGSVVDRQISFELSTAAHDAVKIYIAIYKPRGVDTKILRGSWLGHGIRIKKTRHKTPVRFNKKSSYGENHFRCLFCNENLLTFGWNDGVGSVSQPIQLKLYTHTHWCAMQFVRRFVDGNDEGYKYAYHPSDGGSHRPRGVTAAMLAGKLCADREALKEQLEVSMPLDESLKFDTFTEGRNS